VNILVCGDVVGRAGRDIVKQYLPQLKRDLAVDVAIVNGENAAHGFGINERLAGELYEAGADVLTTGNHVWDQRELIQQIANDPKLLRPANFPRGTPGNGCYLHEIDGQRSLLVINLMGRLFMDALDDPFACLEDLLRLYRMGRETTAIVVDFHGEATSEKMAMGHFADGRVSAVVGTHTHVPTGDHQILPGGTAYMSDLGMCGDYDSVIGLQKGPSVRRFVTKIPGEKPKPAEGEGTLSGTFLVIDDTTGRASRIEPIRIGGRLARSVPTL
jgi:hypothetical protein